MDETPLPEAPFRLLPCSECGYELRGRRVGEQCPECGWRIDAPGPSWCTGADLRTLRWASKLGWIPCVALLLVPVIFVLGIAMNAPALLGTTILVFLVLMPLQFGMQFVAVWSIARTAIGAKRARRLGLWSVLRLVAFLMAFGIVGVWTLGTHDAGEWVEWVMIAAYLTLPLLAVASDVMVTRTLASLERESRVVLAGSQTVLPMLARATLWVVYPLLLIPILGWFFAPILWTTAMAACLHHVGAVARACEPID